METRKSWMLREEEVCGAAAAAAGAAVVEAHGEGGKGGRKKSTLQTCGIQLRFSILRCVSEEHVGLTAPVTALLRQQNVAGGLPLGDITAISFFWSRVFRFFDPEVCSDERGSCHPGQQLAACLLHKESYAIASRASEVSRAVCKDEFRRSPRSA